MITTAIKAWTMIYWIYGFSTDGITSGVVQYFLSEKACIQNGEKFKNNHQDRNYICVETVVK